MLLEDEQGATTEVETPNEETPPSQEDNGSTDGAKKDGEEATPKAEAPEVKTFTQEAVDEIVRNRLERDRRATLKRYGVESRDGLDSLVGKAQSYDIMKERYEKIKNENAVLLEKMAFKDNNINPTKEDDVRAYFKGKGIEFNETNLINELSTHPEWLNVKEVNEAPQTTIKSIGVDHVPISKGETEDEKIKRIFGV